MMTHAEAQERGAAWARAWNARDLESILSHFREDVTFLSPIAATVVGSPELHGKPALRAYWQKALAGIGHLHFGFERALWDEDARELAVMYTAELDARRMRACERMRLDADGNAEFAEALYGSPVASPSSQEV